MRVWRSALGFVAEGAPVPLAVVPPLDAHLPAGPWREYVLFDASGRVRRTLTPRVWSAAEDLGASVYAVVREALMNVRVSVTCGARIRVERAEDVIEGGLREADDPGSLHV